MIIVKVFDTNRIVIAKESASRRTTVAISAVCEESERERHIPPREEFAMTNRV